MKYEKPGNYGGAAKVRQTAQAVPLDYDGDISNGKRASAMGVSKDFDAGEVGRAEAGGFGERERVVAMQERRLALPGARVVSHANPRVPLAIPDG